MKIRQGFVSNSSSSSFIVKFPRIPTSVEEVRKIVFKDKTLYYGAYGDNSWSTDKVAETVFNDIKDQKPNRIEDAVGLISQLYDCPIEYDDYFQVKGDWKTMDHDAYNSDLDKWAKEEFEKFYSLKKIRKDKILKIEGKNVVGSGVFYIFSYSDNDGTYYSDLEHGDLFGNLEHIKISQH